MKVIFCGTPPIAVPALNALHEIADIPGVVCQPDRRAGRGQQLQAPAVKIRALELGLPVFQPERVRDGSLASWMAALGADAALVVAYGRILPPETLATPRLGCVNLHASLLPEYRGAAPIQRALMDGKTETGICLMQMDAGMDTGPVLSSRRISIAPDDDAGTLADKLARLAATVTREDVPRFVRGELTAVPQDHARATHAPPIEKADTSLDFSRPAHVLLHQVRGLSPRPGAHALLQREGKTKRVKVLQAALSDLPLALAPGQIGAEAGALFVGTGSGLLQLQRLQIEGKKTMSGADVLNGRLFSPGDRLDSLMPSVGF